MIDSQIKSSLKRFASLSLLLGAASLYSCSGGSDQVHETKKMNAKDIKVVSEMKAELTAPPFVPKSTADREATKLIVDMEILEETGEMTDGVEYVYWTFGGSV